MGREGSWKELLAALDAGQNVDGWELPPYQRRYPELASPNIQPLTERRERMVTSELRAEAATRLAPYRLHYYLEVACKADIEKSGRGGSALYWPIGTWTITIRVGWWSYRSWRLRRFFDRLLEPSDPETARYIAEALADVRDQGMP